MKKKYMYMFVLILVAVFAFSKTEASVLGDFFNYAARILAAPVSKPAVNSSPNKLPSSVFQGIVAYHDLFPNSTSTPGKVSRAVIKQSSPTSAGLKTKIVMKGVGFAKTNTIYSALGVIKSVPSVDGMITFNVSDFSEIKSFKGSPAELKSLPVYIRVGSVDGLSQNFGYFILNGK